MSITADIARMYQGYGDHRTLVNYFIDKINCQIELDAKSGFGCTNIEMKDRIKFCISSLLEYYKSKGFKIYTYFDEIKKCEFLKISWE